jgi:hypothetical protein
MSDIYGFKPNPGRWTVRRCVLHELVPAEDDHCPVLVGPDSCGLRLSEPFEVTAPEFVDTLEQAGAPPPQGLPTGRRATGNRR